MKSVREYEAVIEVDVKKGKWPFVQLAWQPDADDPDRRLTVIVDSNEEAFAMGEVTLVGIASLSEKKARRLRDFLNRTMPT